MAITGASSYLPTTNEFLAHWASVNAALGPTAPLIVAGGKTIASLTALRDSLQAKRDEIEGLLNGEEIASATIKQLKASLLERFTQFAAQVRALFAGEPFEAALPDAPGVSDAESKFIKPLIDIQNLWERIANSGTSIVLPSSYTFDDLGDEITTLREECIAWTKAGSDLRLARAQRVGLQDDIYPILKQYRQMVPGRFVAGSPYIETLPRLSPLPGSTPKAVDASAVWDAVTEKAKIVWEASDASDLREYQVRYTPGDEYKPDDETVVATIAPNAPRELLTAAGLTQPGASASYKVYVITNTDHEAGSVAMVVTRPT